jgi:HPt (histidine-containing phosphotransfer) domain-containing protein
MVMSTCDVDPFQASAWRVVEPLPAHESVDLDVLSGFEDPALDGDGDLVVELINLYLEEGARLLQVVNDALRTKDAAAIKRAAHSLRGSSGNLGILQMSVICEQMEKHECNDPFPFLEELMLSLTSEFQHVRGILTEERERRTI